MSIRATLSLAGTAGALGFAVCAQLWAASPDGIGETLQDVALTTLDGKPVHLFEYHTGKLLVVAYTGLGCPISGRYAPRLQELAGKYEGKGVRVVGINANPQDDPKKIAAEAAELGVTFTMLRDQDQELTRRLDARTTTEVFVLDKDRKLRYRGMIDDQYAVGVQRSSPKNHYLERAVKDVLKGRDPEVRRTAAPGCLITRAVDQAPDHSVTYSSHIADIIQRNCQACHRPGQIGPFPLTNYEEVAGWSAMINWVMRENRMPPWNASAEFDGHFLNQRKISAEDKKLLVEWIKNGMPRGNPAEDPPAKDWPKDWRIGEPDKEFTMPTSFEVPAEGVVPYQYFSVPTHFKEDKWVQAMEAKPGAEEVVHHIVVFVSIGDKPIDPSTGLDDGFLCATVPGDTPSIFPEGSAKKVPAGASLTFQVHYTTNGKKQRDRSRVGLIFAKEPVTREVRSRGIYNKPFINQQLAIPSGAPDFEIRADHTFDADIEVLSMFPHMHFRGKSWKYVAHYPDGASKVLLDVPRYDFNWQESYIFAEPAPLPKGTRIECIAHYDNSAANFANPDPAKDVKWGDQTWEEMMIGYVDYVPR